MLRGIGAVSALGFADTSAGLTDGSFDQSALPFACLPATDLAENACRSRTGAARSPGGDGLTCPSTAVAFDGLGLIFANPPSSSLVAGIVIPWE